MDEYVKEAEEVSFEGGVGEAYDKEWALRDEGKRESKKEIAKNMLSKAMEVELISEITGLSIEEIKNLK